MFCSLKSLVAGSALLSLFVLPVSFNMLSARGAPDLRGQADTTSHEMVGDPQGMDYGHSDWSHEAAYNTGWSPDQHTMSPTYYSDSQGGHPWETQGHPNYSYSTENPTSYQNPNPYGH